MSTHKCTPPPYTRKLLCRKNKMERAEHSKPHHRHGWVLEQQTAISLGTCHPHGLRWGKPEKPGKSCQAKFSHMHLFNLLHSHLKIATLRTDMRQTWSVKDFPLTGGKSLGHESIAKQAWWCSPAGLGSCCLGLPYLRMQGNPFLHRSTYTQCSPTVIPSWSRMQISLSVCEKSKFSTVVIQGSIQPLMQCHWAILQHGHRAKRHGSDPWGTQGHPRVWQMLTETPLSQLLSSEAH